MGCDIHSVLQVRNDKDSQWRTIAAEFMNCDERDYDLFNILGNEKRGNAPDKLRLSPKGLPEDIKSKIKERDCDRYFSKKVDGVPLSIWTCDGSVSEYFGEHTQNYLYFYELVELYDKIPVEYMGIILSLKSIIEIIKYLVYAVAKIPLSILWYDEKIGASQNIRIIYGMDS